MNTEFCFIRPCSDHKLRNLDGSFNVNELSTGILISKKNAKIVKCENAKYTAYLIGDIYNISQLKLILGKIEGSVWTFNNAEVFCQIKEIFGDPAISMAEGDFCLLLEYHDGVIDVITESRGLNLISLVKTDRLWITNSLKIVGNLEGEYAFDFRPDKEVIYNSLKSDNFSPIRNASRLKPGTINKIIYDEQNYFHVESKQLVSSKEDNILRLQENALHNIIDAELKCSISRLVDKNESIGIPLSGGLDSSLITALACKYFKKVKTWSIGTESSNEFNFAQMVSDALGTEHDVRILNEEEILLGIIKSIYHNEIYDGLSSEIQSGLFNVYELAQGKVSSLLTGYGSDLLFGGILDPSNNYQDPNAILSEQIYRTKWTGEFSTHGARSYGINIYHPFWSNNLISLCHNLDSNFKISNGENKNILREYADSLRTLPKEIVWRKKIGIHEGSSLNKYFANILGTSVNNYQEKTRFSYTVYKEFLTGRLSMNEASTTKIREIMKRSK